MKTVSFHRILTISTTEKALRVLKVRGNDEVGPLGVRDMEQPARDGVRVRHGTRPEEHPVLGGHLLGRWLLLVVVAAMQILRLARVGDERRSDGEEK